MKPIRLIILFAIIGFASCKFSTEVENNEKDKAEAEKVSAQFYDFLSQKKLLEARALFHPALLLSNDSAKFMEFLGNLSNQAPHVTERKLDHWQTKVTKGLNAGSVYALFYVNKFEGGSDLKVSMILQKDDSNHIRIINYNASPEGFK